MNTNFQNIQSEIEKVIVGKSESVKKLLLCLIAGGHALLDDAPGVGKTTLALALSKATSLSFRRVQFTPDLLPSDITGFTVYDPKKGEFSYKAGAAVGVNLLLCDEINRASGKTQSALLEVMEEKQVTVDGVTYPVEEPFFLVATQNRVGSVGTQPLPYAELDRFAMRFSLGYPAKEAEIQLLKDRRTSNPLSSVSPVATKEEVLSWRKQASEVFVKDEIYSFVASLAQKSRNEEYLSLGISSRTCLSLLSLAKANALFEGRNFVIPEDIREVYLSATAHRVLLSQKALTEKKTAEEVLGKILKEVPAPDDEA